MFNRKPIIKRVSLQSWIKDWHIRKIDDKFLVKQLSSYASKTRLEKIFSSKNEIEDLIKNEFKRFLLKLKKTERKLWIKFYQKQNEQNKTSSARV